MSSQRFKPSDLSRAQLDAYLALGWYRIGSVLITTDYITLEGELSSTIWTRLDLSRHSFRPSLRRLMARQERLFRFEFGALVLDDTHEQLYQRYRELVGGSRAESLDEVLGGEDGRRLFETREIRVYRGDELVAFSWFDLGETSVQSLLGVYEPAYRKHGLGFYTLLLEIEIARALGMAFHYAGYILGEPSVMDYKARVGQLEYLDPRTGQWREEPPYPKLHSPAEILRRQLGAAEEALRRAGVFARSHLNASILFPQFAEKIGVGVHDPLLLIATCREHSGAVLTTWQPERERYEISRGRPARLVPHREGASEEIANLRLFLDSERLGECASIDEVVSCVQHFLPLAAPTEE